MWKDALYALLSSGIRHTMNGGIGDDLDFPAIPCDEDDIDLVLKHVVDLIKGSNTLIILDDCASGQDIKNRTSEVVKLEFSARHYTVHNY